MSHLAKRFLLWAAVSSEEQAKKVSLQEQLRLGHEHAAKHSGIVVAELIVPGESRDIVLFEDACRRIPSYQQFYDLLKSRSFDVFCFLNRGRLGRTAALSMAMVELCTRAGVIPYDLESPPASLDRPRSTHADLLVGAIESVGAQSEIIELQRRHAMGMATRTRSGDFPANPPWAWLTRYETSEAGKPKKIHEINPDALHALRIIQEQYLIHGAGNRSIAEILNAQHIPSPGGGAWDKSAVQQVIARALRWAGWLEYNQRNTPERPYIKAKARWPALITEAEAQALLAERERRMTARRSVGSPHRFSGCVWCLEHQRPMYGEYTYSLNKRDPSIRYPREVYRCLIDGKHHAGGGISGRYVDAAVEAIILAGQVEDDNFQPDVFDHSEAILSQIAALQKRIEQHEAAMLKLDDALGDGFMDGERYRRQVERVREQIAGAQGQIEQLEVELRGELHEAGKEDRLRALAANGLAMLETEDIPLAAAWFRQHIRVWVQDCRITYIGRL